MTEAQDLRRPPFDPESVPALDAVCEHVPPTMTLDMALAMRAGEVGAPTPAELLADAGLEHRDVTIPGHEGDEILVAVVQPRGRTGSGPGFFHVHGGGMVMGDRLGGVIDFAEWLHRYNAVLVSVEYRLAPEFPDPAPIEDCYAGLVWTADHAEELGIETGRLIIAGGSAAARQRGSAGGDLAAGTTLLARDRSGPGLAGQVLMSPMIDDRDSTISIHQIDGVGVWDRGSNVMGWTALLGDRRGTSDVSIYAAPARATDLSDLPPTFIEVGSADVFRDEDVAYASSKWAAWGYAELHVWPGGFHTYTDAAPHAAISRDTVGARDRWVRRLLDQGHVFQGVSR